MLKQRQKTAVATAWDYVGITLPSGTPVLTHGSPVTYVAESEFIDSTNGKNRMNYCEHQCYIKWAIGAPPATQVIGSIQHTLNHMEGLWYLNDATLSGGTDTAHPTYPEPGVVNDLSAKAWQIMRPAMSNGAPSLVNALLELKDLKSMFELWSGRQSILKNISNGVLNWNFGWKPFWSDVERVVNGLRTVGDRLALLMARAEEVQTHHWQHQLSDSELALPATTLVQYAPPDSHQVRLVYSWVEPPMFRASARYGYKIVDNGFLTRAQAYLDALGVRLNPGIIWNAIPYTFIVDWFLDVGSWLDQFSMDNLPIEVILYDYCYSTDVKSICRLSGRYGPSGDTHLLWCAKLDAYKRVPGLPPAFSSLQSQLPSEEQWGLLSALAYQHVNDKSLVHAERRAWRGVRRATRRFMNKIKREMRNADRYGRPYVPH